ncbi:TIGR01777 family protein [Pedobacter sp.]|nr:TIGR01777 family protein [Candidatus Saccharibacteria bacterium]
MKVLITGGSGFIGRALVNSLVERGHEVSVIDRSFSLKQPGVIYHKADLVNERLHPEWFDGLDTIVHLAGAPIIGKRWTPSYRDELYASRIISAARMIQAIGLLAPDQQPHSIVSASAIGIYGDRGDEILTEQSLPGDDFLAALCQDWEYAWEAQVKKGARLVCIRTGIVVNEMGGIMARIKPFINFGLSIVFGDGKQWVSWISLPDLASIYVTAVEDTNLKGPINAVAPRPFRQRDFMSRLSHYYKRTFFVALPSWLIVWVIGGASTAVLSSQRVKPAVLLDHKFAYKHLTIHNALDV